MADPTIKVSSDVRDRLAILAAERGTTLRDLVDQLAAATPTQAELQHRQAQAAEYVRTHLRADFAAEDVIVGHQIWDDLQAGRLPSPHHDDAQVGKQQATGTGGGQTA